MVLEIFFYLFNMAITCIQNSCPPFFCLFFGETMYPKNESCDLFLYFGIGEKKKNGLNIYPENNKICTKNIKF